MGGIRNNFQLPYSPLKPNQIVDIGLTRSGFCRAQYAHDSGIDQHMSYVNGIAPSPPGDSQRAEPHAHCRQPHHQAAVHAVTDGSSCKAHDQIRSHA